MRRMVAIFALDLALVNRAVHFQNLVADSLSPNAVLPAAVANRVAESASQVVASTSPAVASLNPAVALPVAVATVFNAAVVVPVRDPITGAFRSVCPVAKTFRFGAACKVFAGHAISPMDEATRILDFTQGSI